MKKILEKSLLKKVERLEAFEERMMIRLENISIRVYRGVKGNYFKVFFEVHPINGTKLYENTNLECVIYDKEGAILVVEEKRLSEEKFFGFEVVEFYFGDEQLIDKIGKIRIYPKKR